MKQSVDDNLRIQYMSIFLGKIMKEYDKEQVNYYVNVCLLFPSVHKESYPQLLVNEFSDFGLKTNVCT